MFIDILARKLRNHRTMKVCRICGNLYRKDEGHKLFCSDECEEIGSQKQKRCYPACDEKLFSVMEINLSNGSKHKMRQCPNCLKTGFIK